MQGQQVMTIFEATKYIKALMEEDVLLQNLWIRGELSNVKFHSRGHLYFTVKDDQSRIQAVMFAGHNRYLKFKPENGMNVIIRGEVNVYEPYGQYQLYAKEMQPDGIGSLYLAFEALKDKLEKEGLFNKERKRSLPIYPKKVAIITSPTGAAIRDIVTTLKRRYPVAQITLFPALVQGEEAPKSIIQAIKQACSKNCYDVLIVGRGGGSIEELWCFNDEGVARAIATSSVPVISAVGHETDYTISDFVADLRAPTPTAAAELAVPDQFDLLRSLQSLRGRLTRIIKEKVNQENDKLDRLQRSYAFKYPRQLIRQKEQELDQYIDRLKRVTTHTFTRQLEYLMRLEKDLQQYHPQTRIKQSKEKSIELYQSLIRATIDQIESKRQPFEKKIAELQLLNPLRLMDRGYSLIYDERQEALIKSIQQVKKGSKLNIRLKDGSIHCQVEEKQMISLGEEGHD